jgi:hypothetical protein
MTPDSRIVDTLYLSRALPMVSAQQPVGCVGAVPTLQPVRLIRSQRLAGCVVGETRRSLTSINNTRQAIGGIKGVGDGRPTWHPE